MRYIILITLIQLSCVVNIQAEEIKYNSEGLVFYNKGVNYFMGDGVPEDHAKGLKFLRKAAELNNIGGQVFLGMLYTSGNVEFKIEIDYDKARKWFVKAIEQKTPVDALSEPSFKTEFTENKSIAQLNLGMYHKGIGVTKDNRKATKFYVKSAENGNTIASLALLQLINDIQLSQEKASIKSPNNSNIFKALENRFNKCHTSFIGTKMCMEVLQAKIKSCSKISTSDFSCKYRITLKCTNNASDDWNRLAQAQCDNQSQSLLTGIFRKENQRLGLYTERIKEEKWDQVFRSASYVL